MRRLMLPMMAVLAVFSSVFGTKAAWATVRISPAYAEVRLDKGRQGGEFEITNLGDAEERFRINALHFTFSRDGSLERTAPDEHLAHSLAQWIVFNPKEFVLPPNARRTVRFVIAPRAKLAPGEYWGCMELESLNTTVVSRTDTEGRKMKLEIVGMVVVPIFGEVGAVTSQGALKEAHVKPAEDGSAVVLEALIANGGGNRLLMSGKYEIADAAGAVVAKGGAGYAYVLAGAERLFSTTLPMTKDEPKAEGPKEEPKVEIPPPAKEAPKGPPPAPLPPLPAGKYTVRMRYTAPQLKEPMTQEIAFDWQPPPPGAKPPKKPAPPAGPAPGAAPITPPTPAPSTPEPAMPIPAPAAGK